jgi:WS/DGAT/MGAT family acyltransferase
MSQQLDRGKPLWETWIVEGLDGGRLAMINKTHHCMIDGVSGVDLLTVLLSPTPDTTIDDPVRWVPRPVPSPGELLRDEAIARFTAPLDLATRVVREPRAVIGDISAGVAAVAEMADTGLRLASETPFNQPVGPHRRFDWTSMDIASIKGIRERFGGTLNDVVLATVAGAVQRFFKQRGVESRGLTFRVFVPVSLRADSERGTLGNRVAGWAVDLPIAESSPAKRLAQVQATTARLKQSNQARGAEILTEVAEWTGTTVLSLAMRLGSRAHPANMVVTNVPGPPQPLYLLGARMLEAYPMVPLAMSMAFGIALFSNAGKIFWGFNADWDAFPDLHEFVGAIEASFAQLRAAAPDPKVAKRPRRRRTAAM